MVAQEISQFPRSAIERGVIAGRYDRYKKPRLGQTSGDVGVEQPACAKSVRIEENFSFCAGAELASKDGAKVLLEAFDPDEVVVMAVADEDIHDVMGDVCHCCSEDLQDNLPDLSALYRLSSRIAFPGVVDVSR
jgi:hypothetical protein